MTEEEVVTLRVTLGMDPSSGVPEDDIFLKNENDIPKDDEICMELERRGYLEWTQDDFIDEMGHWRATEAGQQAMYRYRRIELFQAALMPCFCVIVLLSAFIGSDPNKIEVAVAAFATIGLMFTTQRMLKEI